MPAYPRYRDSGVEWLGEVPEHWEVARLKWSKAGSVNGVWGDDSDGENDIACIRVADFDRVNFRVNCSDPTMRSVTPSQRAGRELREGDLLIEKSGGGERQMVGCVVLYDHDEPAVSSNFIARISPAPGASPGFWTYMHAALYSGKLNYPAIKQTTGIQNLDSDAYFDTLVVFPPPTEQDAIAAFLDQETERIDTLVAKKRLLIERLHEYRTALITRTVTRGLPPEAARAAGLDPAPRLKPSGVEWLRKVPEHWKVKRLKQISDVRYGLAEPPPEDPEGPSIIRATNVKSGTIDSQGLLHVDAEAIPNGRRAFLVTGEILVVRSGAYTGDSSIVPPEYEGSVAGYDIVVRVLEGFPKYVAWQLLSPTVLKAQFHLRSMRAAQQHLNAEDIGETWIACPPAAEQRAIAAYLDQETGRIDGLTSQVETAIERLQEYRTALITAAVTGKIDVRESAREQLAAT